MLKLLHVGKVRDIYEIDCDNLLIYTSDRISVFDNILPSLVPGRGKILTAITKFWCEKTNWIIPNHIERAKLTKESLGNEFSDCPLENCACQIVRRYTPLPIEAIVRGYLTGSAWIEYNETGKVNGEIREKGLQKYDYLFDPVFNATTKAPLGEHDASLTYEQFENLVGANVAKKIKDVSLRLYTFAAEYSIEKGFIIADTKFEFALDDWGGLVLIDEVLTPDCSRYWDIENYVENKNPISYDKQIIRDFVMQEISQKGLDVAKPISIKLSDEIINLTIGRYISVYKHLTS